MGEAASVEKYLEILLGKYGYIGIFLALALGVIGLPIPDEVLLTFIGNRIAQGKFDLLLALGSAFAGAISGISISYFIGLKLGYPALIKYGRKFHITADRIEKTQRKFDRYGNALLVFSYFIPGLRHLIAITAGISNMNYRKFALFSYLGALAWCAFFIMVGRSFGEKWHKIKAYILLFHAYFPQLLLILLIVFLICVLYFSKFRRKSD
ncbi:DedA family protein [Paenibacillus contaminans]|uniref:DedA family protein n=1 Tax=Paenibacillus contaminans TaxID=450362 RepID=A0A329MFM5_9BACL|nr:DedA family protein [Paenibacillus contaminans]RAV18729.1 DedA family protein [Paenibacillus contaminans]